MTFKPASREIGAPVRVSRRSGRHCSGRCSSEAGWVPRTARSTPPSTEAEELRAGAAFVRKPTHLCSDVVPSALGTIERRDRGPVPTISRFYGIAIRMYFSDHAPPHFHAVYAEDEAVVMIETGAVIRGGLPERALRLVREWASIHEDELHANWALVQVPDAPLPVPPLP